MALELSYAGVPFTADQEELIALLEARLPLRYLRETVGPTNHLPRTLEGLALPLWPRSPEPRIGQFFYPVGMSRWAEFHGVVGSTQKAAMTISAFPDDGTTQPLPFVMQADGDSGLNGPGGSLGGGVRTNLYMLPPRPLATFGSAFDDLWLITLVDDRFLFRHRTAGSFTPEPDDAANTWVALINLLTAALGITMTPGTVAGVYGQPNPDSPLFSHHENPAVLMDAVAWNVGRLAVRKLDGTYALQTCAEALATFSITPGGYDLGGGLILPVDDGTFQRAVEAVLPATVKVCFPKYISHVHWYEPKRDYRNRFDHADGTVYTKDILLATAGYAEYTGSGTMVLRTTGRAEFASVTTALAGTTPTNLTALDALALQLAKNYCDLLVKGGAIDEAFPGIWAVAPNALWDLTWLHRYGECWSRVQSRPWNGQASTFQHHLPNDQAEEEQPAFPERIPFPAFLDERSGDKYLWTEAYDTGLGVMEVLPGGRQADAVADPNVAYEMSGQAVTANGTKIVWLWPGYGAEYVFDGGSGGAAIVKITSAEPDDDGLYDGEVQTYNPATQVWTTVETIYVRDANA